MWLHTQAWRKRPQDFTAHSPTYDLHLMTRQAFHPPPHWKWTGKAWRTPWGEWYAYQPFSGSRFQCRKESSPDNHRIVVISQANFNHWNHGCNNSFAPCCGSLYSVSREAQGYFHSYVVTKNAWREAITAVKSTSWRKNIGNSWCHDWELRTAV